MTLQGILMTLYNDMTLTKIKHVLMTSQDK